MQAIISLVGEQCEMLNDGCADPLHKERLDHMFQGSMFAEIWLPVSLRIHLQAYILDDTVIASGCLLPLLCLDRLSSAPDMAGH